MRLYLIYSPKVQGTLTGWLMCASVKLAKLPPRIPPDIQFSQESLIENYRLFRYLSSTFLCGFWCIKKHSMKYTTGISPTSYYGQTLSLSWRKPFKGLCFLNFWIAFPILSINLRIVHLPKILRVLTPTSL